LAKKGLLYATCNKTTIFIKVDGLGSMNNSSGMYQYVQAGLRKKVRQICIDLQSCEGMDSTFMGTLLLIHEEYASAGGHLYLVNLSTYHRSKLDELGISEFLEIGELPNCKELELKPIPDGHDPKQRMQHILRAHEELVERNTDNLEKFKTFIEGLKVSFKNDK
jgi:anti-anti-sigma regulatory factor